MVEANPDGQYCDIEEQKTFLDEPAILDKFKAAALIADRKSKDQSLFPSLILPCELVL